MKGVEKMYQTLEELFVYAKTKETKRLAIAASHDEETLKAAVKGKKEGTIEPILIGNQAEIESILISLNETITDYQIIAATDNEDSARKAVALVKNNQADFLMKGHLDTSDMLRAVVNKEHGIAVKNTISHVNLMELANYPKLVIVTDVAIVIDPTLDQKKDIVENAVGVFNALGYKEPKVAAVCAVEKVNPKMPETVDAQKLKEMNETGIIQQCVVEGPISFDIAMDKGRASRKHYEGKLQGDADVLLMPNLVAGNLLSKGLGIFGQSRAVGFVLGAKVPIVLTSRGAVAESKYNSILACLATL